jgi:hypothetical protein
MAMMITEKRKVMMITVKKTDTEKNKLRRVT